MLAANRMASRAIGAGTPSISNNNRPGRTTATHCSTGPLPCPWRFFESGSIFSFSLTLVDFIIPGTFGNSSLFIGQAVLSHQGTAGNIPLAAAFTVVPMLIMAVYLIGARRLGAFDAL